MTASSVIDFTETVARELAELHTGDPLEELRVWARLAHQREAMVTELYDVPQFDRRLGPGGRDGARSIARGAVTSIWAQEQSHTQFLGSLRGLSGESSRFVATRGRLEGRVLRNALSGGVLARCLIALGRSAGAAPEFARELRAMNLRELLQFHGELELTARMGYARMLALLSSMNEHERAVAASAHGFSFAYDIAKVACEEQFHCEAFAAIGGWLTADGRTFRPLDSMDCIIELHEICDRTLSIERVRTLADPRVRVEKSVFPAEPAWASAGGLEQVFVEHGLDVPVRLERPNAISTAVGGAGP